MYVSEFISKIQMDPFWSPTMFVLLTFTRVPWLQYRSSTHCVLTICVMKPLCLCQTHSLNIRFFDNGNKIGFILALMSIHEQLPYVNIRETQSLPGILFNIGNLASDFLFHGVCSVTSVFNYIHKVRYDYRYK